MEPWQAIEAAISEALGTPFAIESRTAAGGGSINRSFVVRGGALACFVKIHPGDRAAMFAAEAAGLEEIGRSHTVRVPHPICHGTNGEASWIVLEHLPLASLDSAGMATLGRQLAGLHRVTARRYGWSRDNTIGSTPQPNAWSEDWISFWRTRRLGHQLGLAASRGARRLADHGARLMERLPLFFAGYSPAPALLHGDLWSGNAAGIADGEPVLYDPAVYYGDREADLAMTELFGGFPDSFYMAYRKEYPLDPGYADRKPLYNLYHVLNHFFLFGGSYGAQAERMIDRLLACAGRG